MLGRAGQRAHDVDFYATGGLSWDERKDPNGRAFMDYWRRPVRILCGRCPKPRLIDRVWIEPAPGPGGGVNVRWQSHGVDVRHYGLHANGLEPAASPITDGSPPDVPAMWRVWATCASGHRYRLIAALLIGVMVRALDQGKRAVVLPLARPASAPTHRQRRLRSGDDDDAGDRRGMGWVDGWAPPVVSLQEWANWREQDLGTFENSSLVSEAIDSIGRQPGCVVVAKTSNGTTHRMSYPEHELTHEELMRRLRSLDSQAQ